MKPIVPHRPGQTTQNSINHPYEKWSSLWLYPAEVVVKKKKKK